MDTSRLAVEALQTLAGRFDVDLKYRAEGWGKGPSRWKVRILTNKNQDRRFRLTAYGITALEAVAAVSGMVTVKERLVAREPADQAAYVPPANKAVRRKTIQRLSEVRKGRLVATPNGVRKVAEPAVLYPHD